MGYLACIGQVVRRWLPVEKPWSDPKPDHEYFIRPDMSPCCAWHDEHAFHVNPQATAQWQEHLGGPQRRYISERLGGGPDPGLQR
jgi:hypothetical protein